MKEVAIQRSILDLVEAAGGKGWKASHMWLASIPDLTIVWPGGWPPVFAEVKHYGEVNEAFSRKIPLTPTQRERLLGINEIGRFGIVLNSLNWKGQSYVVVSRPEEEFFDEQCFKTERFTLRRKGQFHFERLLRWAGVPPLL